MKLVGGNTMTFRDRILLRWHLRQLPPRERKTVLEHFDEDFYLGTNPDVARHGIHPRLHYVKYGRLERRAPHGPVARDTAQASAAKAWDGEGLVRAFDLIGPEFDSDYYLTRYPDIATSSLTPLEHFIFHGSEEGRNPNAWFNTKAYRSRYPEFRKIGIPFLHFILVGREKQFDPGPVGAGNAGVQMISNALGMSPEELLKAHTEVTKDLVERLRSGELGEMFDKAAEIDPLVAHSRISTLETSVQPLRGNRQIQRLAAMLQLQRMADHEPANAVILIPWNHMGGATRLAGHFARALTEILGTENVLVLRTAKDSWEFPHWFPENLRHVDFSNPANGLKEDDRLHVLFEFIRSLAPKHIVNFNSPEFWQMLEKFGPQIAANTRLFTYLFCNERMINGDWTGYPIRNFHKYFDLLSGVLVDSHALRTELCERFLVPPSLEQVVRVLDTPIPTDVTSVSAYSGKGRPVVFWAGRFDRQKRVDVVYRIAERMPEVDFRLWGESKLDKSLKRLVPPANVFHQGRFDGISDLDFGAADLWLYTSEWDGVPNMLLEVAMTGVPLVGSLSGGTGEVLDLGLSHPVASVEDIDAFVAAIRAVLDEPERARANAAKLRDVMIETRHPSAYRQSVAQALGLEAAIA